MTQEPDIADMVANRIDPDVLTRLQHTSWRETELGVFEEEAVKEAARNYAV